jgi:hypothetical protein
MPAEVTKVQHILLYSETEFVDGFQPASQRMARLCWRMAKQLEGDRAPAIANLPGP